MRELANVIMWAASFVGSVIIFVDIDGAAIILKVIVAICAMFQFHMMQCSANKIPERGGR